VKLFDPGDYWNSGFNIPDDIELNWNYCDNTVFYPAAIQSFLANIQINSHDEIIVLWGAPNRLTYYPECVDAIEAFTQSIPNRVVLFDGNYSNRIQPKHFTYAQISYFEHIARCTWPAADIDTARSWSFAMIGTKDYPTRKYLLSRIVQAGADTNALISYKQINSNGINLSNYTQTQIDQITHVAEQVNHRLPWPALDSSIEFAQLPREFLLGTYVNVITDTFFEGDVFVSEKVYTAIAHGQIFVMLAPAGTLAYLRSQGYRTFGNFIDESYDSISDNYARLQAVADLVINLHNQDLAKLATDCRDIVLHNYRTFYSKNTNTEFIDRLT
jgi:hypothetical protein